MSVVLTAFERHTWERLQVVTESLRREVGRGLADAGLSEAEFTVLAHLVTAGGEARPGQCARSIGWESSRLAHQLGRLERRGLVERVPVPGRGSSPSLIRLTAGGRSAHRAAVGPHLRAAKRWFADALTEPQLQSLAEILGALENHLETHPVAAPAPEARS